MKPKINNIAAFTLFILGLSVSHIVLADSKTDVKTGGLNAIDDAADTDKRFWFKLNGQIKGDMTFYSGDTKDTRPSRPLRATNTTFASGSFLRALELNFNGGLGKDLSYMITLAAEGRENIDINDAYIKYTGLAKNVHIFIGQVPMPYGFENSTSGKWISFLERTMPTADFSTTFRLGAMVNAWGEMFAGTVALTQPKFRTRNTIANNNTIAGSMIEKSDRIGAAGRFIFSPVHTQVNGYHKVYHLSVGIRYQDEFDSFNGVPVNNVRFRARPEARTGNTPFILDTGPFRAKNYMVYSSEAAWISGPFTLQAEYGQGHVRRDHLLGNPIFRGWYAQASYILTGESRVYNFPTGTLGRIIPKSPCGAWEIAVRRSYLNLNSLEINGGIAYNTGFALGWYADSNVRIFGNYIRSNFHPRGERKRIINIFGMRCQIVF
jgi:phosphate-selective porin OprO/OprP